ncbi:MAG: hypothetical protein PHD74_00390 [Candidatus Krumholzibacteria bacterium]|nr:hypothetical protein [Candidatus Krumholzibacteria bacterium]
MRINKNSLLAPILVVVLAGSLAGCYTLLKHPNVAEAPDESDFGRCTDCHDSYFLSTRYEPPYADDWWMYYELPWWHQHPISVGRPDSSAAPEYRNILQGEAVKRSIGGGVGTSLPSIGGSTGSDAAQPVGSTNSKTGESTVIKKQTGDSQDNKRGIEDGNAVKRGSDEKRSDDTKEIKKENPPEKGDSTKASGETKDSKDKKKE